MLSPSGRKGFVWLDEHEIWLECKVDGYKCPLDRAMEISPPPAGIHWRGIRRGKWHYTTIACDDFPVHEGYVSDGSAAVVVVEDEDESRTRRLNVSTGMWINRRTRKAIHND